MFENVAMGSMGIAPNGRGYFSSFRSRDEVNLVFERFDFPSHEEAKVAFQNTLHEAERIVEREVLYDREGKLITGERVVITYRTESEVAAVVSLDDTKLYRIVSASLRHALF